MEFRGSFRVMIFLCHFLSFDQLDHLSTLDATKVRVAVISHMLSFFREDASDFDPQSLWSHIRPGRITLSRPDAKIGQTCFR